MLRRYVQLSTYTLLETSDNGIRENEAVLLRTKQIIGTSAKK